MNEYRATLLQARELQGGGWGEQWVHSGHTTDPCLTLESHVFLDLGKRSTLVKVRNLIEM